MFSTKAIAANKMLYKHLMEPEIIFYPIGQSISGR